MSPHVPLPSCNHVDGVTPISRRQHFQSGVASAPLETQHSPCMRTLYFPLVSLVTCVRMGGATLVSPFLMPLWSTTFSLQNTGGHPHWPYGCPTVLPTIVMTTACRTIIAIYARRSALNWRQHRSKLIMPVLARTVEKRWALGFRDDECRLNEPDGTERSTTTDSQQHQPPTHSAQVAMYRLRLCIVDCRCSSRRPGTCQTLWPKLWAQLRVSRLSPESLMSFTARTRNYELFRCTSQNLTTYT